MAERPTPSVEFVPAAHVRTLTGRIEAARQRALDRLGSPPREADAHYWQLLFEANAAEVLAELASVTLAEGFVVRYRFFGRRGGDLLARPFVARSGTDIEAVRQLIDWHPPPDSVAGTLANAPNQDVELLYRHFSFPPTPTGFFEYWLAMQEVWASARWAHSQLIVCGEELSRITAGDSWEVMHPVETCEPAVVRNDQGARLAVLVHCRLERLSISLQQIDIDADRSLRYADPILIATGPRGYVL
jgi:hypothetical protein